jgi:hypothetical protein
VLLASLELRHQALGLVYVFPAPKHVSLVADGLDQPLELVVERTDDFFLESVGVGRQLGCNVKRELEDGGGSVL